MRVGLCQLNPVVGDLRGNVAALLDAYRVCCSRGAEVVVAGELAVCGYPPEDLVFKADFVADCRSALDEVAAATGEVPFLVGFPEAGSSEAGSPEVVHNAAAVCERGRVGRVVRKVELPTYGVFDEHRWFEPGDENQPLLGIAGAAVGISICEDLWSDDGPTVAQGRAGAELLVNLNGSPYHHDRLREREELLASRAAGAGAPVVYVNQVGGQDDLVFDGGSMVVAPDGTVLARLAQFAEAVEVVDVPLEASGGWVPTGEVAPHLPLPEQVWAALALGTRDYVTKNGFPGVLVGLSGGIDSSLVAAIAVDALGAEHVHGVLMPSRFSSDHSITDALRLCEALGIEHRTIPIEPAHAAFGQMLAPSFGDLQPDLTEENLQSRIRGVTLMALSNKFGWMVLTTGNKSEIAVGYSTLYGDTAGGLAVIGDVYKTAVYDLCRWRNQRAGSEVIPESVLTKAPSAELRPDQRDDQSLPPYDVLDPILEAYVDGDGTETSLQEQGFDPEAVRRICRLVDTAEYKRRQSPRGIRVMPKAFGRDRRLPMTNRYR